MIKRLLTLFYIVISTVLLSQPLANNWINYSQNYYKIKITTEGIYRIDSLALAKSGISLSSIDPSGMRIFYKGKEQAILVSGETDGQFNAADYIEFYATGNDGRMDSSLYFDAPFQPNPYVSLFNDTSVYFLTWGAGKGKRMDVETDVNYAGHIPAKYVLKEQVKFYYDTYYEGKTDAYNATDPQYTETEGFFSSSLDAAGTFNIVLPTRNVYSAGPQASINVVFAGQSRFAGNWTADHHITVQTGPNGSAWTMLKDTSFLGYKLIHVSSSLPTSSLGNNSTNVLISVLALPGIGTSRTSVAYANIKYPHSLDLEGDSVFKFILPYDASQTKANLTFNNFNGLGATVFFYDITGGKKVVATTFASSYRVLTPNNDPLIKERTCLMLSESKIKKISQLFPVTSTAKFTDYGFNAPDSAYLIITHPLLMQEAKTYGAYRASIKGGAHAVVVADIEELYSQFAYGVNKHPFAVRNFTDYALRSWPSKPRFLFLIGKSVYARESRDGPSYKTNMLPSLGNPPCDNLLTAGLDGTYLEPAIPTGRLAAMTPNDIVIYYNKMLEFESAPAAEWMKQVLHFGGGGSVGEQNLFKGYLTNYEKMIEDSFFGGNVTTILKSSSAPIQINQSEFLKNMINNGVSLMTFFGHASGSGFDVSIDHPQNYSNKGRYGFLLANSCLAGDLHTPGNSSSSEQFIFIKDKGVIGYLAAVGLGVPSELNKYSFNFYQNLSYSLYGKSIGENIQATVKAIQSGAASIPALKSTCLEMTLHGDPAMVLNSFPKADYKITAPDVFFDLESDEENVHAYVIARNIGRAVNDSIVVELKRTYPNGTFESYLKKIKAPYYIDTVEFVFPVDIATGVGLNKVRVYLDFYDNVQELSELNNITFPEVDLLIQGGGIAPVYPYHYAIVPGSTVTLKASTIDPFAAEKDYVFQVDTNDTFLNPIAQTKIKSKGGVIEWTPSLTLKDSVVYYWRVSADSTAALGYKWRESSFQYIQGKNGWGQSHFFQFKNDHYQYVFFNRNQRKFGFENGLNNVFVSTGHLHWKEVKYRVNGVVKYIGTYNGAAGSFLFALFNPVDGEVVTNYKQPNGYGMFYTTLGTSLSQLGFEFSLKDSLSRVGIRDFIDSIPQGYYFLGFSGEYRSNIDKDTNLYQAFESLNCQKVRQVKGDQTYVIFGKKGVSPLYYEHIDSIDGFISHTDTFSQNLKEGFIESELIGPAQSWDSLFWSVKNPEKNMHDSIRLSVIGITSSGSEVELVTGLPRDSSGISLKPYVDAAAYPYLKLKAYFRDDSLRTPLQLERWQVIYALMPELAINPKKSFSFYKDTLQEGDSIRLICTIENIGSLPFSASDSIEISYWIEDRDRKIHPLPAHYIAPVFAPGNSVLDVLSACTTGIPETNGLWMEVNPKNTHHQPEQYHFNNIARIPFNVGTDKINPLLDVTFDGVHILNGDIVSANPQIQVSLKDENKFLAVNDTSNFKVWLTPAGETEIDQYRVYFNNSSMVFVPASLPSNRARLEFAPKQLKDGRYMLHIEAVDASKNQSGSINYSISFEVINKPTITHVLNYPNPFSTSTRFVFTLTGSQVPDDFRIQIMTITGKVVKEIDKTELGSVHIGRNITEYAWDGKDEYGDQLANGIYLYKVISRLNGSSIEHRESSADIYFSNEIGKMYLLR